MKKTLALLAAFTMLTACGNKPADKDVARLMDTIVKRLKGGDTSAVEYRKARALHFIDIDDDGDKDVVAIFTIEGFEGGNNYTQFMSVLANRKGRLREKGTLSVGGKGFRGVDFDSVRFKDGKIEVDTLEYGPDDAMCCPSLDGKAQFSAKGRLRELPSPGHNKKSLR